MDSLDRYIADHSQDLVDLAAQLIAFPTVSPPGRNTAAAQAFVAEHLGALGARVQSFDVYPGDPDVVGTLSGSDPTRHPSLILNGHIDVAEVGEPAAWAWPPFQPRVADGRLFGRGASDMKGGLAAGLFALQALRACGVDLGGDLIFESVIGEEQGEAGTADCCARGYRADFAVCLDSSGLRLQGQGGVITGWIEIQSPATLHDGMRARTIHAGGGVFGASAIEKMAKVIAGLQDLERHWAVTRTYPGFAPGTTTINPAVIEGGRHPAFIADRCALWITVHFYPDQTAAQAAAEVEAHVRAVAAADPWLREHPPAFRWGGKSMIVDRGEVFPPVPLLADHPGVRLLADTHAAVTGTPARLGMSPSVADAGWLADAGIPTVIYGPGDLTQAHAPNESVAVADLVTACRVVAHLAADWCNRPNTA
ncbi:MAG TPA: acetylornithine deacetylase [Bacillota bacterium]|nr:acetylornithine deacetylase [Bacillota bacterium]